MKEIYFGTSNIALPVGNKHQYPEAFRDKSRLIYYASLFNSLEVNSTFKKLPMAKTVERWASEVPKNFQFTFKVPAAFTHDKNLLFDKPAFTRFLETINHAGDKKGCLLAQFPGKVSDKMFDPLSKLLTHIYESVGNHSWKIAAEFRHPSLYNDKTFKLLSKLGMSLVQHDLPGAISPAEVDRDPAFIYLRFHGTEKGYRGSYSDVQLQEIATRISRWYTAGKSVYVYFNNTLGEAAYNLRSLQTMLIEKRIVNDIWP